MASPRHSVGGNSIIHVRTHSDRRRESIQQPQSSDVRGRSGSPGSSSLITTHPQTFSANDSLTTATTESARSNASHKNVDDNQELCVVAPNSENFSPTASLSINLSTLQRYSTVLFDHLNRDRNNEVYFSTLFPQRPVSARALQLFLEHIDRRPLPSPRTRGPMQLDFVKFFELSVVLWTYVCSIEAWLPIATEMKRQNWVHDRDNRTPDRLVSWLFLGLLYKWPDVFGDASLELLSNCSKFQDEVDRAPFIPPELLEAVEEKRQKYARDTYTFIRNQYLQLLRPASPHQIPLVGTIYEALLEKWKIDILRDLPPDLYRHHSPEKLLQQIESTTSRSHSQHSQFILSPRRTGSIGGRSVDEDSQSIQEKLVRQTRGNRNSEAADGLSYLFSKVLSGRTRKKKSASIQPGPPLERQVTRQELDEICDRLLSECRTFREQNLKPLNLETFSALRSRHVLLGNT